MARTIALQAAVGLLLASWLGGLATGDTADGFLEGTPPVALDGSVHSVTAGASVWVQNPGHGTPESSFVIHADEIELTRVTFDVEALYVDGPGVGSRKVVLPNDVAGGVERETVRVQNATVSLSALDETADVLLAPTDAGGFIVQTAAEQQPTLVGVSPDGMLVRDGFREQARVENGEPHAFDYDYARPGPLVSVLQAHDLRASGDAHGYIWGAHVVVREGNQSIHEYDTGMRVDSGDADARRSEHYEYLVLEIDGLETHLRPGGLSAQVLAPGMSFQVDGTAEILDAMGTLQTPDGVYEARTQDVGLSGRMSLTVTPLVPSASTSDARAGVSVNGDIEAVNLQLAATSSSLSTPQLVAYGAGAGTLVGLAAWYVASVKGASVAAPLLASARPRKQPEEQPDPTPAPESPGELLFDPDRFSLYHLIRSRPGLCARQAAELTGIPEASAHLELLAQHGLLETITDEPKRYGLPNALSQAEIERVAFLREPAAHRLAELLIVHGLTPESRLVERARNTQGPLEPGAVPGLLDRFVHLGLAYREQGEHGPVVDPTDGLTECLRRMGEHALPEIS